MSVLLRAVEPADLPQLLRLNTAAVPAVNLLAAPELDAVLAASALGLVVAAEAAPAEVLGFAVAFVAGAAYDSENYRWFSARSDDFLYVDRIVVAPGARGQGLGRLVYDALFDRARSAGLSEVCCEVNLVPPNPESLAFHARLGFGEVGRQSTKSDTVVVALLAAPV